EVMWYGYRRRIHRLAERVPSLQKQSDDHFASFEARNGSQHRDHTQSNKFRVENQRSTGTDLLSRRKVITCCFCAPVPGCSQFDTDELVIFDWRLGGDSLF